MTRAMRQLSLAAAVLAAAALARADEPAEGVIRGTVVDEDGRPVAGATVDLFGLEIRDGEPARPGPVRVGPERTGPDGGFTFRPDRVFPRFAIRATADDGARLGTAWRAVREGSGAEPLRIVLRPSRPLTVRVADAAGKPVAGAAVEVLTGSAPFGVDAAAVDPGTTDDRGIARFRLAGDAPFKGVLALKEGVGVDYFANAVVAPPAELSLTLRGSRTITLRALDSGGRPIPGIAFRLDGIGFKDRVLNGRLFDLSGALRITEVRTDASGLARWGWLREECSGDCAGHPPGGPRRGGDARPLALRRGGHDPERPAPALGPPVGPGRQRRRLAGPGRNTLGDRAGQVRWRCQDDDPDRGRRLVHDGRPARAVVPDRRDEPRARLGADLGHPHRRRREARRAQLRPDGGDAAPRPGRPPARGQSLRRGVPAGRGDSARGARAEGAPAAPIPGAGRRPGALRGPAWARGLRGHGAVRIASARRSTSTAAASSCSTFWATSSRPRSR